MRGLKRYSWLFVFVMALTIMSTTIQADSTRIVFSTDRTTADDFDLWKMQEDGGSPTEMTDETEVARNPCISRDATKVVYDVEGEIWMMNADDSGSPENIDPCDFYATDECADPDAGPHFTGFGATDFLIVFTRRHTDPDDPPYNNIVTEIWIGTVDVSEGDVDNVNQLTSVDVEEGAQLNPAWCGDDHIVWDRESTSDTYKREICHLEVDEDGPIGSETCYFVNDGDNDNHPSCSDNGRYVAWSRTGEGSGYSASDICKMDLEDADPESTKLCLTYSGSTYSYIHTKPTWAPSGTVIAFASDRPDVNTTGEAEDFDIYSVQSDGTHLKQLTDKGAEDDDPNWGGELE